MGQKVTHTFFSAPILKHQTYFLQELTQNERIQPVPVDLGNLCHIVPIYRIVSTALHPSGTKTDKLLPTALELVEKLLQSQVSIIRYSES